MAKPFPSRFRILQKVIDWLNSNNYQLKIEAINSPVDGIQQEGAPKNPPNMKCLLQAKTVKYQDEETAEGVK